MKLTKKEVRSIKAKARYRKNKAPKIRLITKVYLLKKAVTGEMRKITCCELQSM
jgi:hypothetical protein